MRNQLEEIRIRKGKTNGNILLIAPHGHRDDDENTGALTREIQKRLDCHAIINEVYRKPKRLEPGKFEDPNVENKILDLNNYSQAKLHKSYIRKIKELISIPENTYVFWIHGIADQNLAVEANRLQADGLKGLVCYGQPDRHSVNQEKVEIFAAHLNEKNFNVGFTSDNSENYRGWSKKNMNQFFRDEENGLKGVYSVQLEFGYAGVRDDSRIPLAAQVIAEGIAAMAGTEPMTGQEPCVDEQLVANAYNEIQKLIEDNNAMSTVGHYLVATFYADNYEWAKSKKGYKDKSLKTVIQNLNVSGHAPGKTWFYNAVKLAVDEHAFSSFRTYGMIGHSHKVYLTHVNDFAEKKKLIEEIVNEKLTVKQLRIRIAQIKSAAKAGRRSVQAETIDELQNLPAAKREKEKKRIEKRKEALKTQIENLKSKLESREKELRTSEKLLQQIDQLNQPQAEEDKTKKAA